MMHTRDLLSYLVAVKSFASRINPQRIVMVCDPTVSRSDRLIVAEHIPHIEFRDADEFVSPQIPRGGTWERIYAISEYAKSDYVIQLDADTVTRAEIPEVAAAVSAGAGFVLGESPSQTLLSFSEISEQARRKLSSNNHIQTQSEAALIDIGLPPSTLYVRGCSGFSGFPVDEGMRECLLDFSARMSKTFGQKWASWGTEQVTSNYLVANANKTQVLPFPKYGTPDVGFEEAAFLHFIGSMRFINGKYQQATNSVVRALG